MGLRISRIRKGISGSAVAAAAMAALTASQAPDVLGSDTAGPSDPADRPAVQEPADIVDDGAEEERSYHTDLPPLDTAEGGGGGGAAAGTGVGEGEAGIPATVLDAYRRAAETVAGTNPGCDLEWEVLAAIGKVESGHARGGDVSADGTTTTPILGPVLDGNGFAQIMDTDRGRWDSDSRYDRAVGPMQFIPSTWARWGADGNGDGVSNPNNVYDAALAAGNYLCASGRSLADPDNLDQALLSYNHSWDYVATVRSWLDYYRDGVHEVPDGDGGLPTSPGPGNPRNPGATGAGRDGGSSAGRETPVDRDTPAGGDDRPAPRPPVEEEGSVTPRPNPIDPPDDEDPGEETEEPTEPEEPGGENPSDPGEDPSEPTDPDDPADPDDPQDPECPVDPDDPDAPADPDDPEAPETGTPQDPAETEDPATEPADPENPDDPDDPENPDDPEDPDTCGEDPEDPAEDDEESTDGESGDGAEGGAEAPAATATRRAV
ncbi:lytic transglycosylase domain-containing protein [Streptomyces mayteni]